jgi:ABC-2 type transport system ATP-binding protein
MRIGYMPDFFGVYDNLNAVEYLEFYAACYGIRRDRRRKIAFELLERVNLAAKAEEDVDRLSRGMKQRLGLARALVHDPDLLILDEPASGLDPKARVEMRDILKELRDSGKTVLISSHILPELADLCDAIGVMENGRLVASGSVAEIAARLDRGKRLVIEVLTEAERAEAWLRESPHVVSVERENRILSVRFIGSDQEQVELLAGLVGQNIAVKRFSEEVTDLENVFLQIMQATEGGTKDGASEPVVE